MKKGLLWVAGCMVLGLALSNWVWAKDQAGDQDHPGMGKGMIGKGRLEVMKKRLGLTDTQADQLKDLFKAQMENNKTLRDQAKVDMDTLQLKVDSKASNDEIHKLLDQLDNEHKSLQASREKMKEKLRNILTPTQQAKMLLGMKRMAMMGGGHHGKGMERWMKNKAHHQDMKGGNDKDSESQRDDKPNADL